MPTVAYRWILRSLFLVVAGVAAGATGCSCASERGACARDGECGDGQVCYPDDKCVPRDVAERVGAVVGDECAVVGGDEVGCAADEICRMGFCRGADDHDAGADADGDGPPATGCTTGTATDMAPLFGGAAEASADGADATPAAKPAKPAASPLLPEAKSFYAGRCVPCHGAAGRGDGPTGMALTPKPRNFTDRAWQKSVTDLHIEKVILQGGPSVGKSPLMPPHGDLSSKPELLAAMREVVRGFGR